MRSTDRTIIVLGARLNQVPVIQAAKTIGLRVIAVDPSSQAPGLELADAAYCLDLADSEGLFALAKASSPSGVLTFAAEYPVPSVAQLCQAFGLTGLTPDAARLATNKKEMRRALVAAGVPSPVSIAAQDIEQAESALREIGRVAPLAIFKPAVSNDGRGVTQVPVNAPNVVVDSAFKRALSNTRGDGILVEEFVAGPEYSVECVAYNGSIDVVAVTDKQTSGAPYFVEIGHSQPAAVSAKARRLLGATAIEGVKALGIDWAGIHAEIRLSPDGPRVMEIAGRFGGGYICSHLVPLSTGIDIPAVAVRLALGEKPELQPKHRRGAAIRFLTPVPGVVTRVLGVEVARKLPGVHHVHVAVRPGDRVKRLIDGSRRIGFVICDGANAAAAVAAAEAAKTCLAVETKVQT